MARSSRKRTSRCGMLASLCSLHGLGNICDSLGEYDFGHKMFIKVKDSLGEYFFGHKMFIKVKDSL